MNWTMRWEKTAKERIRCNGKTMNILNGIYLNVLPGTLVHRAIVELSKIPGG